MNDYDQWKSKTTEDISIQDLYDLYEDVISELYKLLGFSCNRFMSSNANQLDVMMSIHSNSASVESADALRNF